MDVNIRFLKQIDLDTEAGCTCLRQGQRGLRAFLHHIPQLPGENEMATSRNARRFDEKNITASRRPCKTCCHTCHACAHGHLFLKPARPKNIRKISLFDLDLHGRTVRYTHGNMPANRTDRPFEIPHPGFPRIVANEAAERIFGNFAIGSRQAACLQLPLNQISTGYLQFLVFGVAGKFDDFHSIADRTWNGIEHIGGRDEYYFRQIKRHSEIIVAKHRILLRIQHFKECCGRIAVSTGAELIHFIEHHDRVPRTRLTDRLNDISRKGANICAPVPADFGFVVNAPKAQSNKFAPNRFRDALPK